MTKKNEPQAHSLKVLPTKASPPMVSIVGYSGSGKTTFIEKLIPELKRRGLRIGTVKHDVHGFELDKPGKDSWRHKRAGASTTIISSADRIGVVMDVDADQTPEELRPFFAGMDLILVEGYKRGARPKLEVFRPEVTAEPLCRGDEHLLALINDAGIDIGVPAFSTADVKGVADFLVTRFKLNRNGKHMAPGFSERSANPTQAGPRG